MCSCRHLGFKHVNDARNLVRILFVPVSLMGHPHFGHFIGDLLASPWQEYATAGRGLSWPRVSA
jgi:hypothetical protein